MPAQRPNLIILVVDCLRSDRLFGPDRTCRTPHIDRLVQRGASFPSVFVENSMTAPSFASLFTGRYAANHGVKGMIGVRLVDGAATLAEIFAANGYHTYAEVTGPLTPLLGLCRGFTHYGFRSQRESFFTAWGRDLLTKLRSGWFKPPFLLVVHFWELHVPRQVVPAFDHPSFGATPYDRSLSGLDSFIGEILAAAGPRTAIILTGDHGECLGERPAEGTLLPYFLRKLGLAERDGSEDVSIEAVTDLMATSSDLHRFAEELSASAGNDGGSLGPAKRTLMMLGLLRVGLARYRIQLKKGLTSSFLSGLRDKVNDLALFFAVARGKTEKAQVALVRSSLNEHKYQHGYHIYEYLQKVPLVLVGDGLFPLGKRVDTEVRHIDFLPTLIEAFGLETTASGFDGASFHGSIASAGGPDRPVYLEARGGAQVERIFLIRGVRRNGLKLAYAPYEVRAPVELYDLSRDPLEQNNLAPEQPDLVEELRSEAEALSQGFGVCAGNLLSAADNLEMARKLKDLGYL